MLRTNVVILLLIKLLVLIGFISNNSNNGTTNDKIVLFVDSAIRAASSVGINNNGEQEQVQEVYNPQQTCKPWTTPKYRSLSRSLEGAHVMVIDDIINKHQEDIETNTHYEHYEHEQYGSGSCGWEPNLLPMTVQFAKGYNETFYAYVQPDVSLLYNQSRGTLQPNVPTFPGQIVKFINMSPHQVQVYWQSPKISSTSNSPSSIMKSNRVFITDIEPFGSASTASYPTHKFILIKKTDDYMTTSSLMEWVVESNNSLYYYDPYKTNINDAKKAGLTTNQIHMYHIQLVNMAFAHQYKAFTNGTEWLAVYKHKPPPRYHMWRCDYIGQTYLIDTAEIHYVELPPPDELYRTISVYGPRPHELDRMRKYKATHPILNLTITALSCSPRVFEIQHFLSDIEVDHILYLAKQQQSDFQQSRTASSSSTDSTATTTGKTDPTTRSSRNIWIGRNTDMITDAIYRRSADVLQIHEALLRWRRPTEIPEFPESMISIAERLQLVHYAEGQEYTPHHDFSMPSMVKDQPSRFATMLFYLNDDMEGGETVFPRWLNANTGKSTTSSTATNKPLTVKPQRGKAILFYNMLPDGNYDERSIHAAMKVIKGEKYLLNLWVWDPILDHTIAKHI